MGITLDEILELMPELKLHRDEIKRTLDVLDLLESREYLSIGIGKNKLPLIIALHGLKVIGFDINEEILQHQRKLSTDFAPYLQKAGGSLEVINFDVFYHPPTTPPINHFYGRFDYIECVNFNSRDGERELAQTLLNFGKSDAVYFVSSFAGPIGADDKIVKALIEEVTRMRRSSRIIQTNLFTSDTYTRADGVVLKVY